RHRRALHDRRAARLWDRAPLRAGLALHDRLPARHGEETERRALHRLDEAHGILDAHRLHEAHWPHHAGYEHRARDPGTPVHGAIRWPPPGPVNHIGVVVRRVDHLRVHRLHHDLLALLIDVLLVIA